MSSLQKIGKYCSLLARKSRRSHLAGPKNIRTISYLSDLPDTHEMLRKTCRDFADNELAPIAGKLDASKEYPVEQVREWANKCVVTCSKIHQAASS